MAIRVGEMLAPVGPTFTPVGAMLMPWGAMLMPCTTAAMKSCDNRIRSQVLAAQCYAYRTAFSVSFNTGRFCSLVLPGRVS